MGPNKVMYTFFSIFLSTMFDEAFLDERGGVYIQSRQSADLFNVAHFRGKIKITRILMRELLFALRFAVHWLPTLLKRCRK